MDTIKAHNHVITDDHIEFILEAMQHWMIHKPKRTRKDRDHYHHLNYILNRIQSSHFGQVINYKQTKDQ